MAPIIEKRRSLNMELENQRKENSNLRSRLTKLQTLANMGTVSALVAHEINNILMPLGNYAMVALNSPEDGALTKKALEKTVYNSSRASEILESILGIVNGETAELKHCKLKNLVEDVFACIGRDFGRDGIKVCLDISEDLEIYAVPVQMQQVFMNLILNAREAIMPRAGTISIKAESVDGDVIIEVCDSGSGISPSDMKNLFIAFFTTKTADGPSGRNGAGLGLVFCKEMIDSHNGTITVESQEGQGTKFIITLPEKTI
ncbi:MAG: HAMP domain-containing histidine kinase [Anaerohalosphaeraceae bacterium]|nr:HAMP domain-containing histidine kinase [Anaerohalosphaeraceae bacterium]